MDSYGEVFISNSDISGSDSDALDSDIEEALYSQVYHELTPDCSVTPRRTLVSDYNHTRLKKPESNDIVKKNVSPKNSSTPLAFKNEVNKPKTVIEIESDSECEIVNEKSLSKYSYSSNNSQKRKLSVVEVSSSDDEADNLYVHLKTNEDLSSSKGTINVESDSEQEAAHSFSEDGDKDDNYGDTTVVSNETSCVSESRVFSLKEVREREMRNFFDNYTKNEITSLSAKEIISSLKGTDWYVSPGDRMLHKSLHRKGSRIVCMNCRERGHIARICPAAKKEIVCHLCGGSHPPSKCMNRCCVICWQTGHFPNKCAFRKTYLKWQCSLCKCYGHGATVCPDLWRKYHLTIEEGPIVTSTTSLKPASEAYCPNCATRGHFIHQCKKELMDEFTFAHRLDIVSYSGLLPTPTSENSSNSAPWKECNKLTKHKKKKFKRDCTFKGKDSKFQQQKAAFFKRITRSDERENKIPNKKKMKKKTKLKNGSKANI